MENFVFKNATKIIFGKNTETNAGKEVASIGKKVLLHYGADSIKKSGLYDRVIASLKEANVEIIELGGVQSNPRLSLVRKGIELCRKEKVDCLLAVGGGSVIDSAKSIGIGVGYKGDVWDFYTGKALPVSMMPLGVVLTIPAAGSEASGVTVITCEDGWYKRPCGADCLRPSFSILNPELSYTLPAYQTACGAADIMAHVMERYFTNTRNVDFTDRLCEATLRTVIRNAPIAIASPCDYASRSEIMWAGCIAHNDLLGTGRIGDWASHYIEHELSGMYDVAHGAGLATIFPAWMTYVYKHDIKRFVQFANRVWDVEICMDDLEGTAIKGIECMRNFFRSLDLPITLGELKIPNDRLAEIANKSTKDNPMGSFVKLYEKDVLEILLIAAR